MPIAKTCQLVVNTKEAALQISLRFGLIIAMVSLLCLASAASDAYFPKGIFSDNKVEDRAWSERFSKQLAALHEAPLYRPSRRPKGQSYRFLWERSFHPVVAVRLDIQKDGSGIIETKTAGTEGSSKKTSLEITRVLLTKQQTDQFLGELDATRFWEMPTRLSPIDIGPDGAQWLLEGVHDQRYHLVLRWSPKDGAIRKLGLMLVMDLGRLKIPADQIY